jgi:outer membrane protein OmpA-like peptidoglycan-associated protein
LAAGLAMPACLGVARAAEEPSMAQIIKALRPARLTRGLAASPVDAARSAEEARFVDTLRKRTTRSLTTDERQQIVAIAKKKPSIDLEINFEYDAATIGPKAMPQVTALGQALSSDELKGRTFIVAGHTDAKGGEAYNQGLSERRADAVKRFLSEKYAIDASRLVTAGYGKTELKNSADPFSGENRRVQVINMSDK